MNRTTDIIETPVDRSNDLVVAYGRRRQNECVLHLDGPLRIPIGGALRHSVGDLLRRGERRIVLDLARVPSIDAAGVGQLVRVYNLTTAADGVLRIVHATPWVREILERVGLFTVLTGGRD